MDPRSAPSESSYLVGMCKNAQPRCRRRVRPCDSLLLGGDVAVFEQVEDGIVVQGELENLIHGRSP